MNMGNSYMKKIFILIFFVLGVNVAFAAENILDVTITERGYEELLYNPLKATGGIYVDANENRSLYFINGTIVVINNHGTEAVQDTVLNISGINNIYNLNQTSGREGYVVDFNVGGDYAIILIPDLGAGQNSTFTYNVNVTNIAPALNFTTSYADSKIFAGLPITITDNVENTLNSVLYPNNCIYDISITQFAMEINASGTILNNTYDNTSMVGTDAGNATFTADNRTINWNLWSGGCFYSTNLTDIGYDLVTPVGIGVADNYMIINTTITYTYNDTFSRIDINSMTSVADMDMRFDKFMENMLTGDNATWRVNGSVFMPSNITVNLTSVNFWVSLRDGTGTGFTNPSIKDNDSISGVQLNISYPAGILMNNTLAPWTNAGSEWFFNYTYSASPIVWMDLDNNIVDDGIQLTNRSVSYGENSVYIKEIYIATGYWLEITKNITRLSDNRYNVYIRVVNLGTSPTPADQVVQVYNFLPIAFTLNSSLVYSPSPWYNTAEANETLNDPIYNGTMFQFGIIPNGNIYNSSFDIYGGASNQNNTWTLTYNVTGSGEFSYDDLFLTGLDPLHVEDYGSTQAVTVEGVYGFISSKVEIMFAIFAGVIATMALFF